MQSSTDLDTRFHKVLDYHAGSKHHPQRYAPSPGRMDWANEPDPFRRYLGAPIIQLPFLHNDPDVDHFGLYRRLTAPRPITLASVGALLELSLGLSAWKSYGSSSWSLRMNPSSGDLHPTECHLVLPPLADAPGGVFHYHPYLHVLEQRTASPPGWWESTGPGFLVALTSIIWREAWKYGVRAFRYCAHDIGHAVAGVSCAAALLGWRVTLLTGVADEETATMLGFPDTEWPEQEMELPQCLMLVHPPLATDPRPELPPEACAPFASLPFTGTPSRLSAQHRSWPAIGEVAVATLKPRTTEMPPSFLEQPYLEETVGGNAADTVRRRRSAQAFDGHTPLSREAFLAMLDKTLPRAGEAPFDVGIGQSSVHLFLFVHRVEGLEPGLYCLARNRSELGELRQACAPRFLWTEVAAPLPLFLLQVGACRDEAALASCGQEIAGDGAFAVAMVGRFRSVLAGAPWRYRHLHWEAGMIGQVLYLEAEAHGMRGTGIGCFFDDVTHKLLGLEGMEFQDLYHFTVGKPVEDPRLMTLPPYGHLRTTAKAKA